MVWPRRRQRLRQPPWPRTPAGSTQARHPSSRTDGKTVWFGRSVLEARCPCNVEAKLGWTTGHDESGAGKARVLIGQGGRWAVMACNPAAVWPNKNKGNRSLCVKRPSDLNFRVQPR